MRICGDESTEAGVVRSAHNEPARPLAGARCRAALGCDDA